MDIYEVIRALQKDDVDRARAYYDMPGKDPDELLPLIDQATRAISPQQSPLFYATRCGSLKSMKYLLSKGADQNFEDPDGDTPLNVSAGAVNDGGTQLESNRAEAMTLLLENHAAINHVNKLGQTALMIACYTETLDAVSILLSWRWGADVNIKDNQGYDAMHYAKWSGYVGTVRMTPKMELIRALLRAGADPEEYFEDGFRLTVADYRYPMGRLIDFSQYRPNILDDPTLGCARLRPGTY